MDSDRYCILNMEVTKSETLLHRFLYDLSPSDRQKMLHRGYAIIFWSDSIEYLLADKCLSSDASMQKKLVACLHRVQKCDAGRFSVVFKQRTTPLKTACRYDSFLGRLSLSYQEDFPLAKRQLGSLESAKDLPKEVKEWQEGFYSTLKKASVASTKASATPFFITACAVGLILNSFFY